MIKRMDWYRSAFEAGRQGRRLSCVCVLLDKERGRTEFKRVADVEEASGNVCYQDLLRCSKVRRDGTGEEADGMDVRFHRRLLRTIEVSRGLGGGKPLKDKSLPCEKPDESLHIGSASEIRNRDREECAPFVRYRSRLIYIDQRRPGAGAGAGERGRVYHVRCAHPQAMAMDVSVARMDIGRGEVRWREGGRGRDKVEAREEGYHPLTQGSPKVRPDLTSYLNLVPTTQPVPVLSLSISISISPPTPTPTWQTRASNTYARLNAQTPSSPRPTSSSG